MKICQSMKDIHRNADRNLKQLVEGQARQASMLKILINSTQYDVSEYLDAIARLEAELISAKKEIAVMKKNCEQLNDVKKR